MNISDLDRWLAERNLNGFWNRPPSDDVIKPYHWKWADIYEGIQHALDLIPMDQTGRRVVQMRNPGLRLGMTRTLHLSVQAVAPGERAKAHRHVAAAIRYVIQGSPDCFTIVEGERFAMEDGDLVTTPNWAWHDHVNASDHPVLWVDGLDARLVTYFDANLFEPFAVDRQPIDKPDGYTSKTLSFVRPTWMKNSLVTRPFRYSWTDSHATLQALKVSGGDPCDGILLQYVNPENGGPTLPTFACQLQLLPVKYDTQAHRHMSTTVYFISKGCGTTIVGNDVFHWDKGDFFVVPPWQWHKHKNRSDQDAILFSVSDWPVMSALGVYREEVQQ